jgi:hypothetical protein
MTIVGIEDEYIQSLPLLDERGYEILLDENGDEVLDENGDPVAAATSCMQVEPVDVVSHTTIVVAEHLAQKYRRGQEP